MAKKAAKKKSTVRSLSAKPMSSCECSNGNMWLAKVSLVTFVFFIISVIPALGNWVTTSVSWWVWLIIAIIFGLKPIMNMCKK